MTLQTRAFLSLEERREMWHLHDVNLNSARRDQAQALYELFLDWLPLYPKSSVREFITWQGQGEYQARLYAYVFAGLALHSKLDWPELRLGDLDTIGRLIWAGKTEAEVKALYEAGGMEGVRTAIGTRETTNLKIPMASALEARQIIAGVSDSDTLGCARSGGPDHQCLRSRRPGDPERSPTRRANGREPARCADHRRRCPPRLPAVAEWPALRRARLRGALELHHLKAGPNARFRSNDVLLPLCTPHHQARPGITPAAAHAANQDGWATEHFGSVEALWQHVALQLTEWAEAQRGRMDE